MEGYVNAMTQLSDTERYIISLIRAVMQEQPLTPVPDGISLQELYDFSRLHSVEALVYRGLCQLVTDTGNPVWKKWQERENFLLAQSAVQFQERDDLIHVLTAAGIDLMPVKGCWLKELYPDPNDRQMSDLDMLIHPDDAESAERILLRLGYRKEEVCFYHTSYFKSPYTVLELHISLLPDIDEHGDYYETIWDKAVSVAGTPHLYRLKPEDEYIYYIVHLNKHLSEGGSGLRSILDSSVYFRCWPDMDQTYLRRELEALGLEELWEQVRVLSQCWFENGQELPEALIPLAQAVCRAGTYGSLETRTQQRMQRLKEQYRNPVIRFFAYCLPRFFRPMSEMKRRYPVLVKAPFLLPVFWIVRIVSMMLHNEKSFWQHLKLLFREGSKRG